MGKNLDLRIRRLEQDLSRKLYSRMESVACSYGKCLREILTQDECRIFSIYLREFQGKDIATFDFLSESNDPDIQKILTKTKADHEACRLLAQLQKLLDI